MATKMVQIEKVCRFCLCEQGLMALSEALTLTFTIENIIRFTGVKISLKENIPYAICFLCFKTIERSVIFRSTCMHNNTYFSRLLSVPFPNPSDDLSQKNGENINASAERNNDGKIGKEAPKRDEPTKSNDFVTISLIGADFDDFDDAIPAVAVASKELSIVSKKRPKLRSALAEISYTYPNVITLDDSDNEDSMSMSNTNEEDFATATDVVADNTSLFRSNFQDKTSAPETKRAHWIELTKSSACEETQNDEEANCWWNDSDSNDSLLSLYSEVMLKEKEERKQNNSSATQTLGECAKNEERPRQLCQICGILIRSDIGLHLRRVHFKSQIHACPLCPARMFRKCQLKNHINSKHERRLLYTCEKCGKGCVNRSSYKYHMDNSHGKSNEYECEECHKKFKSYDSIKRHRKQHLLAAFACPYCNKFYTTTATLEAHLQRHHPS